jgi:photosystem I subunit 2
MFYDIRTPAPRFEGSTGGWLRSSQIEECYSMTWTSPKTQIFEMPTGGTAKMVIDENLIYFARKEQCLALANQLKSFKILDYKIYRLFPNGVIQHLHPKEGVFPEKINRGRIPINSNVYENDEKIKEEEN